MKLPGSGKLSGQSSTGDGTQHTTLPAKQLYQAISRLHWMPIARPYRPFFPLGAPDRD
jgi:hypothetical protein